MDMVRRLLWVTLTLHGSDSPSSYKWPAFLYKDYSELISHLRGKIPETKLVELALHQLNNPKAMNVPVARLLGRSTIVSIEMDEEFKPDFSVFTARLQCAMDPKLEDLRLKDEALYVDFHRGIDDVGEILSRAGLSGEHKPSNCWLRRAQSSLQAMKNSSPDALTKVHDCDIGKNESDGQVVAAPQHEGSGTDIEEGAAVQGGSGDYGTIQENNTARDSDPTSDSSTLAEVSQSQISVFNPKHNLSSSASGKIKITQENDGSSVEEISKDISAVDPQGAKDSNLNERAVASQAGHTTRNVIVTSPSKLGDQSFHVTPISVVKGSGASLDWQSELKIELNETWDSVKDKLQYAGFTCTECGVFIPPNGKGPRQNGVKGRHFYDENDIRKYVRETYGWKGSTARNEERTPKKRKSDTAISDRIQERPKRQTRTPCKTPRNHDEFWNFKNIMPYLRRMGWKYEESKNLLKDWCYVLPERRQESGTYGVDFFYEEEEVVEFSKKKYTKKDLLSMEANVMDEATQQADSVDRSRANAVSP